MKRIAATHAGTCQICGRVQKLPSGKLSLHGYQVQWNFFNGTCGGAKHLPFEKDKAQAVAHATLMAGIARQRRQHASDLRQNKSPEKVWIDHPLKRQAFAYKTEYRSMCVDLFEEKTESGGVNICYIVKGKTDSLTGVTAPDEKAKLDPSRFGYSQTASDAACKVREWAASQLDYEAEGLERYVKWQRKRCGEWQLRPLLNLNKVR